MLDSSPMTNWRKLLTVVFLMLSLSARAFGAAPLTCELSQGGAEAMSSAHDMHEVATRVSEAMTTAYIHGEHHLQSGMHHHGSGHCSTCVSCCVGGVLPSIAAISIPSQAVRDVPVDNASAGSARFLTGGIERPPRLILA